MGKPCFKCGTENLSWKKVDSKWVGYLPDGKPHDCVSNGKKPSYQKGPSPAAVDLQKAIVELTIEIRELRKVLAPNSWTVKAPETSKVSEELLKKMTDLRKRQLQPTQPDLFSKEDAHDK